MPRKPSSKKPRDENSAPDANLPPAMPIVSASDEPLAIPDPIISSMPALTKAFAEVRDTINALRAAISGNLDLTVQQRQRLIGARRRNWGFITKSLEIVEARPAFRPPGFSVPNMATNLADAEEARQLLVMIDQLRRVVDDFLLQTIDALNRDGLQIYGNLQALTRAKIHGAKDLFDILRVFFALGPRSSNETEPTLHKVEAKLHGLLHGTSDGKIIVEHESPHMVGGEREVVVDVHKHKDHGVAEMKVKEEE